MIILVVIYNKYKLISYVISIEKSSIFALINHLRFK